MVLSINFSHRKLLKKSANDNIHDPEYWDFAHALAENSTPINQWPKQYTVHYMYEFLNRPWLTEQERLRDMTQWMQHLAPSLTLKI